MYRISSEFIKFESSGLLDPLLGENRVDKECEGDKQTEIVLPTNNKRKHMNIAIKSLKRMICHV